MNAAGGWILWKNSKRQLPPFWISSELKSDDATVSKPLFFVRAKFYVNICKQQSYSLNHHFQFTSGVIFSHMTFCR